MNTTLLEPPSLSRRTWHGGCRARRRVVARRDRLRAGRPRRSAGAHPAAAPARGLRPRRCSARFWSTSGEPYTSACISRDRSYPTPGATAPTSCARSRRWVSPSSAIPAATSSPATTGSTVSGPKAQRPTVLDRAWNSLETNQFGTNDFVDWCRLVGAEPLLGMNFGTGTAEMAVAYVEYCNLGARHESGATCGARTATSGRTTSATGASATRWTARGRSASCRRANADARRATPPSRCASSIGTCS